MKGKALLSLIIILVIIIAAGVAWFYVVPNFRKPKIIKFGCAVSLSGKYKKEGEMLKAGIDLWKDLVNEKGGIKVKGKNYKIDIIYYDDLSNPQQCASLVERLIIQDKVNFILGPFSSGLTFTSSSVCEKYKIPMVTTCAASDTIYERNYKYIFGVMTPASYYFKDIIDIALKQKPKPKKVAIIAEDAIFSLKVAEGGRKAAKNAGMDIIFFERYPKGSRDLISILTKLKEKNPDIILGAGHYVDSLLMVRQAKELNISPKIFALSVGPSIPTFVKNLGDNSEYIVGPVQWSPVMPYRDTVFGSATNYAKIFRTKYKFETSYQSAAGSAAGLAFQYAIQNANSLDREKVRDALAKLDIMTFYGRIKFDHRGADIFKPMAVIQIQKGKQVVVYPEAEAGARFIYPFVPWDQR